MLPQEVLDALGQPLDESLVSTNQYAPGGSSDYIKIGDVMKQANRIFGIGNWGYELASLHSTEVNGVTTYYGSVKVTIEGAHPMTNVGVGIVAKSQNEPETPNGHGTAIKAVVANGITRALRAFGPQFGEGLGQRGGARSATSRPPSGEPSRPASPQRTPAAARPSPSPRGGMKPCSTDGCNNQTSQDYCMVCQNEMAARE